MKHELVKYGLSQWTIDDLTGVFRKHPKVSKVIIFGSRAKGNYRPGSDIDLAVEGNDVDFKELMSIMADIDDLGLLYMVDVVDYNKEKGTPIGEHVGRVGKVFYDSATDRHHVS